MNPTALNFMMVFVGAGVGGALRYLVQLWVVQPAWLPVALPTLVVNTGGGLLAGMLLGWLGPEALKTSPWGVFLMTGLLGGLTTFSAFTAEGYQLLITKPELAALQAAAHVLLCLLTFALGFKLVGLLTA